MLQRKSSAGFSYVELVVTIMVLAVLSITAIPVTRWVHKRRDEAHLKVHLEQMRNALDLYHDMAEQGLIQMEDVEQENWPLELDVLAEGVIVGDPESPEAKEVQFLREIPIDPMTGKAEWGLRSWQDDWDSDTWGGENVYDVYSLSRGEALDGTYYSTW